MEDKDDKYTQEQFDNILRHLAKDINNEFWKDAELTLKEFLKDNEILLDFTTKKEIAMIKRFSPPTHLDVAPQYEQYHVENEDGSVQIWIQMNEMIDHDTKPHWRRLGDLFEEGWLKRPNYLDIHLWMPYLQ